MYLDDWERNFNIEKRQDSAEGRFTEIIKGLSESLGTKVVILIDEYDSPLSAAIDKPELFELYRDQLHGFYSVLKAMESHIQFCMLTGVTKFGKVSVFSGLNNLDDITFNDVYAGVCGITESELHGCLSPGVSKLAAKRGWSEDEAYRRLKFHYDGYHFSESMLDVYNPYSVLKAMAESRIRSYWCSSGLPTLLSKMLREEDYNIEGLNGSIVSEQKLDNLSVYQRDAVSLFYQTGYLTIKDFDPIFKTYTLDYPNDEVRDGFMSFLVPYYIKPDGRPGRFSIKKFVTAILSGDAEGFMSLLADMLAGVPYSEKGSAEAHFQNACYILFSLMGQFVAIEDRTSDGRIDLTVETPRYIYIFELKADSTPEAAMEQIRRKKYWLKFQHSGKEIILIGANFDTRTRRLGGYLIDRPD